MDLEVVSNRDQSQRSPPNSDGSLISTQVTAYRPMRRTHVCLGSNSTFATLEACGGLWKPVSGDAPADGRFASTTISLGCVRRNTLVTYKDIHDEHSAGGDRTFKAFSTAIH